MRPARKVVTTTSFDPAKLPSARPATPWLTAFTSLWEFPTVKVQTIDAKRRLVLPGAKPGECYAVRESAPGHHELARVVPAPKPRPTPEQLDALLVSAALTPKMSWDELRTLTREP